MELLNLSADEISLSGNSKYDDDIATFFAAFKAGTATAVPFTEGSKAQAFAQRARRLIKSDLEQGGWVITVRTLNKHSDLAKRGYASIVAIVEKADNDDE